MSHSNIRSDHRTVESPTKRKQKDDAKIVNSQFKCSQKTEQWFLDPPTTYSAEFLNWKIWSGERGYGLSINSQGEKDENLEA